MIFIVYPRGHTLLFIDLSIIVTTTTNREVPYTIFRKYAILAHLLFTAFSSIGASKTPIKYNASLVVVFSGG